MIHTSTDDLLVQGRKAYEHGDAEASRQAFERALEHGESGEALEGMARALHLAFDYRSAMAAYERAYSAYRSEGNFLGAARAARTIGWFRG